MEHHRALILVGFLAIGATYGCGPDDGGPVEIAGDEGAEGAARESGRTESIGADPRSYRRRTARGSRDYLGADAPEGVAVDSCCDKVEAKTDATVFVSPRGNDDAAGTQDAPVLTLARAMRLAAERGHTVYVSP